MRTKRILSAALAAAMVTGIGGVALATSASAVDFGPALTGNILWFNAVTTTGLGDANLNATAQIDGSLQPNASARPWKTLALSANCPAGTAQIQPFVHIPAPGSSVDWDAVSMGASDSLVDAQGRFYLTGNSAADAMSKPQIHAYATAHPGLPMPYVVVCQSAGGDNLGYFTTPLSLTVTGAADSAMTYSIPKASLPGVASSTTLAVSPAGPVEAGDTVTLTATVAPAPASGSVEFFAGTTSLGTSPVAAGGVAIKATSAIPVGTNAVTAVYAGGAGVDPSTSAPSSVVVTAVAARATTTTLAVSPVTGDAYQNVTFTTTVTAATGLPNGTVSFYTGTTFIGSVPCTNGIVPAYTSNLLGAGAQSLTAQFVGTAPYSNSTSNAVSATYALVGAVDPQSVDVVIPVGAITITTPYHPAIPATGTTPAVPATTLHLGTAVLDQSDSTYSASAPFENIVITDTRSATTGFTAKVVSGAFTNGANSFGGQYAGLWNVAAHQVVGNALQASDVVPTQNPAPATNPVGPNAGLGVAKTFASYTGGTDGPKTGSVKLDGTFGVDQVPSSVPAGTYAATITFTAI